MNTGAGSKIQKVVAIVSVLLLPSSLSFGQVPMAPPQRSAAPQQSTPLLSPEQLDNLVAPVALYPDPLLGQVLAASTYPLEIVEAQQWLQQNSSLQGAQLVDAARQQNWDPSVQALVAFPDALSLLSNDIRWSTDLGNAFLSQQADVMSEVQRMRARATANGKLSSTPQQVVTTDMQDGQSAIEIQPADPQVIYVPVYQPEYVWGPPEWGAYPDLWYPPEFGLDFGFGFGPGIFMGGFFPGWGGWGGWGWGCGWFGNGLFVNAGFLNRYGFRGGFGGGWGGRGFEGRSAWAHDPGHRLGVPYPNQTMASRFHSSRFNGNGRNGGQLSGGTRPNAPQFNGGRSNAGQTRAAESSKGFAGAGANGNGWRSFNGNSRAATNGYASSPYRQSSPNYGMGAESQSYRAPAQNYRGYNSAPAYRSAPSYNRSFAPSYSAPRQSFSAPRSSGGGGFSGARSGFSGGHAGGGGGRR
ncbi:MAG: DUF3300 domain-containing protein [Bryobacteraceae bacterium]|jgi:hypothetical protein